MAEKPQRPVLGIKAETKKAAKAEKEYVKGPALSEIAAEAVTEPEDTDHNIRLIRSRIGEVFFALGTESFPGTVIPMGSRNNSKEAADFVVADALAKLAAERLKKASEAAEKSGVFGDPDTYVEGDTVMVFSDPNFSINVKMGKPSQNINREQVEAAAKEYLGKRAEEFMEKCMKPRKATKQIIVSMK